MNDDDDEKPVKRGSVDASFFQKLAAEETFLSSARKEKLHDTPLQIDVACANKKVPISFFDRLSKSETLASSLKKEKFNPRPKTAPIAPRKRQQTKTTQHFFDKMGYIGVFKLQICWHNCRSDFWTPIEYQRILYWTDLCICVFYVFPIEDLEIENRT